MGRDLLHCPYCHGDEVRDQPLGVLGVHLRPSSTRCWCASGRPTSPGSPTPTPSEQRGQLQGVELRDGTVVPRAAVFVRPRCVPNAGLLTGLGGALEANGWVVHDPVGRTSVAGDAADPHAQVITAAGQGPAAAIARNADLVDEDVQHALANHRTNTARHGQPDQGNAPRRSH